MNAHSISIQLFGGVTILQGETAVTGFASRKAEALLLYLACNPRPHPRETVATLLWPDNAQNRALGNLSVALSSIRKLLPDILLTDRHTVRFNLDADVFVDTAVFEQTIHNTQTKQTERDKIGRTAAAQLATAVSLYKGAFLAGFNIRNAIEFEDWMLLEQERLRQQYIVALAALIRFNWQRGQLQEGIRYAQQLLATDPLQESIHRQLMQLQIQNGQRGAALAQYEQCVRVLADELGVEPDEETIALYEQIVNGEDNIVDSAPAVSGQQHNLPVSATAFVGRADEIAQIEAWMAQPNSQLLTVVAPGGMGKTRLAQEAARAAIGTFADGVWLVSLVAQTTTEEAFTAVAAATGFTFSGTQPLSEQLLAHLNPLETLLIFDNMEHLLTEALLDFISQLLTNAPDLFIIATSRERLRLQAETVLDLTGLSFPNPQSPAPSPQPPIPTYPAVSLFTNRAQKVQPAFTLDGQETAVIHLCQLVGGLPLALELAATWTRGLSVADIVAELQKGLGNLTTTLRDIPARHRSLHAVIETSWQQLSADEQQLFRRLAVFRGGFTRTAAAQVAAATVPQLLTLLDRSFIQLGGDQRYRRHPLLRQFAQERLAEDEAEESGTTATHARTFAKFVSEREPALYGSDVATVVAEIGADLENIRLAWQWGLNEQSAAILHQMITGVSRFFSDQSRYMEASAFFENSLLQIEAWPQTAVNEQIGIKCRVELGFYLTQNGRFDDAEAILLQAKDQLEKHDLVTTKIACLKHLGDVSSDKGNWQHARTYLEEALALCRNVDQQNHHQMVILNSLANHEVKDGRYEQAMAYFNEAMILAKAANQPLRVAILHNNMAIVANRLQHYEESIQQYELAYKLFEQNNHDWGMAATTHNIGMAYTTLEQYEQALAYTERAHALHKKIGHQRGLVGGLASFGNIYHKMGKRRQARRYFYDGLRLSQEVGVTWAAISILVDVAGLEISYGAFNKALLLLTFAVLHPAVEAETKQTGEKLLDELRTELSDERMREVETAVQSYTLEAIIDDLINGRLFPKEQNG